MLTQALKAIAIASLASLIQAAPLLGSSFGIPGDNATYDYVVGGLNQSLHYARGKTLGGCTARNFMVYQRGTEGSYQNWANAVGDQSYTWQNFHPYFKKSVNFTAPQMSIRAANSTPEYDAAAAGGDIGPLSVTYPNYAQAFGSWAIEGFKEIGISIIRGFLSGQLLGQSWSTFTLNAQTMLRDSSETSFLREGMEYDELKVYPLHLAKQILFDNNKKATGVLVDTDGFEYVLSAKKEVILSAGMIGSPQLLLASGVGPAQSLKSLNIPVVADRPGVGQGLQDHAWMHITYRVNGQTISSLQNPEFAAEQAELFVDHAEGMYTSPNTDVLAWEKIPQPFRAHWSNETKRALDAYPADWPEVEYITVPSYLGDQENSRSLGPNDGYDYASLAIVLIAPRSRGSVTITSPDTKVSPLINPNYLTVQSDIDILIGAFKRIRQFWGTPVMQSFAVGDEYWPGKNVTSDADIEHFIRQNFNTIWHGTSTCAMGRPNDKNAVVDSKARVIGVQGLRVVDASAFPFLPPGHPMSTVYVESVFDMDTNVGATDGEFKLSILFAIALHDL
ncbi:hypothetical protein TCE0_034f12030 [Talaromyces pinophilus]|uniref:Uncharacterized protein n=1 Tax=Talaromyces pinophilus TaxID=128442 RepID=A0A6V8HFD1_TALPI|nr:hypothetical protein TCE0_034f12030 [Talaromyces pinophilus]